MLRRRDFEKIQNITGFNIDILEKTYHLMRTLKEIYEDKLLSNNITLKGGTSLNFLYLDIPRLSIDLDFNFTGSIDKDKTIKLRPNIEDNIEKLSEQLGYKIVRKPPSYILSRYNLQYQTIRNTKDHIKIEINYLERKPIGKIIEKHITTLFPDIDSFKIKTYTLEELAAQKIKACIERTEARDIYDIYRISKQDLNLELLQKYVTIYYCMTNGNIDIESFLGSIREYNLDKLKQEIQQFIRNTEDIKAEEIQKDTIHFLEKVLNLGEKEKEFINIFYRKQKIRYDLLFKDRIDIKNHPSLLHRIYTLQKNI